MTKEITDKNFDEIINNSKNPVLVDFWAPWCGPCKQLSPIIDQLSSELEGKIDIYKCNIDDNPESPSKYAVRGIPTMILFKKGKIADTKVGSLPKSTLFGWIEENI